MKGYAINIIQTIFLVFCLLFTNNISAQLSCSLEIEAPIITCFDDWTYVVQVLFTGENMQLIGSDPNAFYGNCKGQEVKLAFSNAQRKMCKKYKNEPLKWAAFVLFE